MELISAIIIMVSGALSLPGLVSGDAEHAYLVKTKQCTKDRYIYTTIFTEGDINKPLDLKVRVRCTEWFK